MNKYNVFNLIDIEIKSEPKRVINKKWKKKLANKNRKRKIRKQKRLEKHPRKYARVPRKYNVYIKSHWWTDRRSLYWKTHKKKCYRCDTSDFVQLHHIKYGWHHFGHEPDDWLIPMCAGCHTMFHNLYGCKADMNEDMLLFEKEHPFIK